MIRPSSVAMGELVAVGGAVVRPGEIIHGLNELSSGAFPFTQENFRDELVAVTANGSHSEVLEATSSRLAEIIRETMENIRLYGVPLADAVVKETSLMYSRRELQTVAADEVYINFINADDPFFSSNLFPTAVANPTLSYKSISLDALEGLQFDWPTDADVRAFVNSDHPDIVEILDNPDCALNSAVDMLTSKYSLQEVFTNENGLYNFQQVRCTDITRLLKAYIVLTKMRGSEDPVPWLRVGSLDAYREYVNVLWNGFTAYLLQLRDVVNAYRAQNLVIVQEKEVHQRHTYKDFKSTRMLTGSVKVFYTNAFLQKVLDSNLSMQEVVLGFFWARLNGRTLSTLDVFNNPKRATDEAIDYFANIHDSLTAEGRELFIAGGLRGITAFIDAHPEVQERVQKASAGKVFQSWLYSQFWEELNNAYNLSAEQFGSTDGAVAIGEGPEPEISERSDILLSTNLVPHFLRTIGCNLAADLISDTFVRSNEDNVGDKRERLHVAMINLIVRKLVAE